MCKGVKSNFTFDEFPSQINLMLIHIDIFFHKHNNSLNNLPNLTKLSIKSCFQDIEIKNLPTSLIELDLCNSSKKFNLDYLPPSLTHIYSNDKKVIYTN